MSLLATASTALNPWLRILAALEKKINRQSFDTWFKPTRFSRIDGRVLVISVPTREFEHIGERYNDLILEAIDQLAIEVDEVAFEALEEEAPPTYARSARGWWLRSANGPHRAARTLAGQFRTQPSSAAGAL